jgi:uncharacterized protein (DUF488 family)
LDQAISEEAFLYAIGHSTRPLIKFIELLQAHHIEILADIRTVPRSRTNPQFNQENLARELPSAGIRYVHLKALGGLRRPAQDSLNLAWENSSFRGYADYMQTPEFDSAVEELVRIGQDGRTAIMCAEGNPFRCHRTLVADALTARGLKVFHIVSRKTARPHALTPFAQVQGTRVNYPASASYQVEEDETK